MNLVTQGLGKIAEVDSVVMVTYGLGKYIIGVPPVFLGGKTMEFRLPILRRIEVAIPR